MVKYVDNEKAVISALVNKTQHVFTTIDKSLDPHHFGDRNMKFLYEAILDICKPGIKQIDLLELSDHPIIKKEIDETELFEILNELTRSFFTTADIDYQVERVLEASNRRKAVKIFQDAIEKMNLQEDTGACIDNVAKEIANIKSTKISSVKDFPTSISDLIEYLEQAEANNGMMGVPSGFKDIDHCLNGFKKSQLIILAAQTSMGKTILGLNFAKNAALNHGKSVLYFTLEMSSVELTQRLMCDVGNIHSDNMFKNGLNKDDWIKFNEVSLRHENSKLHICDEERPTVHRLGSICRDFKNSNNLDLIVVDYLHLIDSKGENETVRVGNISKDLKALAKSLQVPIICLCQLSRDALKNDDKPKLHHLRQSGQIEQDADVVMLLSRNKEKPDEPALVDIAKNRNGPLQEIKIKPQLSYYRFKDLTDY